MFKAAEELILASGSPRRHDLLKSCGLSFRVIVSDSDETVQEREQPEQMVKRLALLKASAVAQEHPHCWVIGADTTVAAGEKILGKPACSAEAEGMLGLLQGRSHQVWGGFAILNGRRKIEHVEAHCTTVKFRSLTPAEIKAYVATGEPADKAGAYAAQGIGAAFVSEIQGSYTNVVGLPLSALMSALLRYEAVELV